MLKNAKKYLVILVTLIVVFQGNTQQQEWDYLIDENLSQWELWMGIPHVTTGLPGATSTTGTSGGDALGLNNDPLNVFSVINVGGELQLKITGEVYGGLTTLEDYSDFHLSMEFKWGEDKFEPRLDAKRDSGILYHCQGKHGSFWRVWKSCLEFQVQETDCGDFYGLAGGAAAIQSRGGVFSPGGNLAEGGRRIRKSENFEFPNGEWNTLEVIAIGDKSIHFVNGKMVNALQNTTYRGDLLNDGQLQIQSEGAEIYYRNIKIKSASDFPTDEKVILGWDDAPVCDSHEVFSRIESEDYCKQSGIQTQISSEGTDNVGWINDGDWLMFESVDLTGAESINARVASDKEQISYIEVRLDEPDGDLIGTIEVNNTGDDQQWETVRSSIDSAPGEHKLYFVFTGGNGFLFNINWVQFSPNTLSNGDYDQSLNELMVFPNPVEDKATVLNALNANITIYNMNGSSVFTKNISGKRETLNLEYLSAGIYYGEIIGAEIRSFVKIIKK